MASTKRILVPYRRRREQRTDYKKRLKLLLSGKPRLVVRFTNTKIVAQIITFGSTGDTVLAAQDSTALKNHGWIYSFKNIPAAYLTGMLLGKKALQQGCSEAIFDTGFKLLPPKGRLAAFLQGAVEAGLLVPHGSKEIFSTPERLQGEHIAQYLKSSPGAETIMVQFKKIQEKIKNNHGH